MTVFISNRQLRHAKTMHITYDLNTLGPRQRIELSRAIRTGLVKGESICNDIALALRKKHKLGHIRFHGWGIRWEGLASDEFDPLTIALATHKLTGTSKLDIDTLREIEAKKPSGWIFMVKPKMPKLLLKSRCSELDDLITSIESGKVTELTLPVGHDK